MSGRANGQSRMRHGVTMQQVVITTAIIGILALIAIPKYQRVRYDAKKEYLIQVVAQIHKTLMSMFLEQNPNEFPPDGVIPDGLDAWVTPTALQDKEELEDLLEECDRLNDDLYGMTEEPTTENALRELVECFYIGVASGGIGTPTNQYYFFLLYADMLLYSTHSTLASFVTPTSGALPSDVDTKWTWLFDQGYCPQFCYYHQTLCHGSCPPPPPDGGGNEGQDSGQSGRS